MYNHDVRITIFTNGTIINNQIVETFRKRPPEQISITLYGATNETYELITSDSMGFTKLKNTLQNLKDLNLNIVLRTIPLKPIFIKD